MKRPCSLRDHFATAIGRHRLRVGGWTASRTDCRFRDGDQDGEAAHKKMLRMQVAPNMLLKTKRREKAKPVLANMFVKTSRLSALPIS
jgi:hypothetical protein